MLYLFLPKTTDSREETVSIVLSDSAMLKTCIKYHCITFSILTQKPFGSVKIETYFYSFLR